VADGVGGWTEYGVDAGQYSKTLCKNMADLWQARKAEFLEKPVELINTAFLMTDQNIIGSTTIVAATLKNNILHIANIGDSGMLIIRN